MAYPAAEIDAWFATLEEAFEGKLPDDHALIRKYGGQGWRVKTMGVGLLVLADRDFPYSNPQAFIDIYDHSRPQPHIEPMPALGDMAKICLRTPTAPHAPLTAVRAAVSDARELLKSNENGEEEEDFENDFAAYWASYLPTEARTARLSGLSNSGPGIGAFFFSRGTYYCFPDKELLRRWTNNLTNAFVRDPLQFPIIEVNRLPRPNRFPTDSESLFRFLKRLSPGGLAIVGDLLRAGPRRLPVVFSGKAPNGRTFKFAVELVIKTDAKGRPLMKSRQQSKLPDHDVVLCYDAARLSSLNVDAASTRLPEKAALSMDKKVIVVGCGALGSGIAVALAKSGVSRLVLIDPEVLGWENIRRHELGAEWVSYAKVTALQRRLERSIPDLHEVAAHHGTIQEVLASTPDLFNDAKLIISATGDWGCDVFISDEVRKRDPAIPTLYTWTEAFGLASHAVVLSGKHGQLTEGFDEGGSFKGIASHAGRKPPPECGNATSPFGAVEVAQSQALAARLTLEVLGGRHDGSDVWRTWTAEQTMLDDVDGKWSDYWLEHRGQPPALGAMSEGPWSF